MHRHTTQVQLIRAGNAANGAKTYSQRMSGAFGQFTDFRFQGWESGVMNTFGKKKKNNTSPMPGTESKVCMLNFKTNFLKFYKIITASNLLTL